MGLPEAQAGVASAAGGAEGFEAFYVREYHAVARLAYALSGSRLVAEDIAGQGPAVAEIARTLGLAEGTVKAQLHRGRQALANRLAEVREDDHER
jgi:DNA-directed RNA polymerase specialized sigma24 family protein